MRDCRPTLTARCLHRLEHRPMNLRVRARVDLFREHECANSDPSEANAPVAVPSVGLGQRAARSGRPAQTGRSDWIRRNDAVYRARRARAERSACPPRHVPPSSSKVPAPQQRLDRAPHHVGLAAQRAVPSHALAQPLPCAHASSSEKRMRDGRPARCVWAWPRIFVFGRFGRSLSTAQRAVLHPPLRPSKASAWITQLAFEAALARSARNARRSPCSASGAELRAARCRAVVVPEIARHAFASAASLERAIRRGPRPGEQARRSSRAGVRLERAADARRYRGRRVGRLESPRSARRRARISRAAACSVTIPRSAGARLGPVAVGGRSARAPSGVERRGRRPSFELRRLVDEHGRVATARGRGLDQRGGVSLPARHHGPVRRIFEPAELE